jgi:[ribosomal protein S5]-alanine N-acetyltransferase
MNIFTKRLHLREFRPEDWAAVYLYRSDPEVKRYDTFGPNTVAEVHEILACAVQWQAVSPRTHYFAAVVLLETQQLIGECGLFIRNEHDLTVAGLGYAFQPQVWGRGYATETVQALLQFGFGELHLMEIEAECNPANIASWRVLEKVGMERVATLAESSERRKDAGFCYAIRADQWSG